MLKKLKISNLAIIDNIELDLDNGFNVFTGQTGAGKSLIIDSISLLFGKRSDSFMIREGFNYAYIFGLFSYTEELDNVFKDLEIDRKDDITIERFIYKNKSVIKVNDKQVTLNKLNLISSKLGDICSQSDTYKLFNKDNYLSLLIPLSNEKYISLLQNYQTKKEIYLKSLKKLNDLITSKDKREEELAYASFAYNDISSFNLKEGELEEVENNISKLKNFDKIYETLTSIINNLSSDKFDIDTISKLSRNLEKVSQYDKDLIDTKNSLDEAYVILNDTLNFIKNKIDSLSFSPEELENLNKRDNEIKNLMLKYHRSYNELLEYLKHLEDLINNNLDYDYAINLEESNVKNDFNNTLDAALKLTNYRKEEALKFQEKIIELSHKLDLKDIEFTVFFEEIDTTDYKNSQIFLEHGIDQIDFLVSFNKEKNLLPMSFIASGGEMSRLMLAFKLYNLEKTENKLLVLDEIDTGVSGVQSKMIGNLILNYSLNNQVLLITHNPIIASQAMSHYLIKKIESGDRIVSRVSKLNDDEREKEIAIMLEGEVSDTSLKEAQKLIKNASNC